MTPFPCVSLVFSPQQVGRRRGREGWGEAKERKEGGREEGRKKGRKEVGRKGGKKEGGKEEEEASFLAVGAGRFSSGS